MSTFQTYWMVLGIGQPTYRHMTLASARTEAARLASMHPGSTFVVLEAVCAAKKADVQWMNAATDAEEIPF